MANEFRIKNGLIVEGIDEVGSDTDKFLMSDSGKLKYVTGANLRSYIGAGTSSTDGISFDGSTANGVLTYKDADEATVESNLTFDGSALQLTGTLTVGVDDTGHDVKFFGATAGAYMLYDQSEDHLLIHGPNDVLLKLNDGNDSGSHMTIAGARAKVGYSGNNLFLQGSSSKGVAFGVNNGTFGSGEVARFDTSGNFGIGTTSPSGRLHVETTNTYTNGISGATAYFKAINTQSSAGYPMTLVLDSDWTGSGTGNDDVRTRYLNAGVQKWQHNVGSNLVWYYDTSGDNSGSWSERMTFTSAGALSVDSDITSGGTITADAADIGYIQIRSNNEIETDSSSIFLQYNTGNDVEVGSTGTNADLVVIGRVGIAPGERLNSPSAPLHVNGGSGEAMPLRLERATAGGANYGVGLEFVMGETGDANAERVYGELSMAMDGASGNAAGGSSHDGYFAIRPSLNGTPTERMRILSGGNVGIGTTSPAAKLTVAGSAYLQTASANLNFRIHADTDSSPAPRIEMMRGAHDTWGTGDNYNDWRIENINHLKFYSGTSSISSGAAVERFEILSDGSGITNNNAYVIPGTAGTSGQVLKWPSSGTILEWADESGGGWDGTSNLTVSDNIKLYFGSTDSYIYATTDAAEHLMIASDSSIWLDADADVVVRYGSTEYARFDGSAKSLVVEGAIQGYKTVIKTVSSNTTLADDESGQTIYWTGGTLTLPATAQAGQQFVIINNTGGSATPGLGTSNAIVSGWTAHAAMDDETARTYISPATNKWLYIG